ncbi:MAG: acetate--CoA ligase family protein [Methanomassiliicoccales archaeon]|jgi:acyl-CoA synthetase (NDP forming)|nr:acetate--CoA ligase family protein [Methanomassiliicoccales archaeon]
MDIVELRQQGRRNLSEYEVKTILRDYGIKTTNFTILSRDQIESAEINFPVAVKVCSSDIMHKTDVGGVFLNVRNREELRRYHDIITSRFPGASVLVEPMEKPGVEVIVGLVKDKTFGMSIMFGIGGVLTELYNDVSFRLVPITRFDAEEMIDEIKAQKLFRGFRNVKTDRESLLNLLVKVARFGDEYEEHINQLDLNPVFVREYDTIVIDAKLVLEPLN